MKYVPKIQLIQGLQSFPSHLISIPQLEICGDMPSGKLHNQGLEHIVDLEHKTIIAQRTLDLINEDMYNYPILSLLSYTQHFLLKCGFLEDGMIIVLINTMLGYEFSIVYGHEKTAAPSCRSGALSLRSNDEMRAPLFLEHSEENFTHEAL